MNIHPIYTTESSKKINSGKKSIKKVYAVTKDKKIGKEIERDRIEISRESRRRNDDDEKKR